MSIEKVIWNLKGYEDVTMHHESDLRALNRVADGVTSGVIVAIGSYRGQSDCALALHAHVPVYALDPRLPWDGEPRQFGDADRAYWMENVMAMGLAAKIRPIELPSLTVVLVWDQPIGMFFIDGKHPDIAADLDAWLPHVVPGGLVAVHDNNLPDIIAAVTSRDDIVEIERPGLTTVYRKEPLYEQFTYDDLTLWVRKGPYNKDDRYVLGEVRSYDIGTDEIRTCIDVGCHIGAFSAWIQQLYPGCQIVAIEPEMSGYLTAQRNLRPLTAQVINARVNYAGGDKVLFVDPINSGSHRVLDAGTPGLTAVPAPEAVTLEQIMSSRGWTTLDLLKLDCEGAEADILTNCTDDFLRNVRRIVGEFHANFGSPMEPIAARLEALGFDVTWEQNPAAHATFCAVNREFTEPDEELPFEYGVPVEETTPKLKSPVQKKKVIARGRKTPKAKVMSKKR